MPPGRQEKAAHMRRQGTVPFGGSAAFSAYRHNAHNAPETLMPGCRPAYRARRPAVLLSRPGEPFRAPGGESIPAARTSQAANQSGPCGMIAGQ
jgi:hypothetical protein